MRPGTSPASGRSLLIQSEYDGIALVEASPSASASRTNPGVEGKTWNNPALSGRYLLVRNAEQAACWELPLEPK